MPAADLAAGDFSTWLAQMQAALRGEEPTAVPCGTCTACCTSSQFVHIGPEETDALGAIPEQLLFPAPGMPEGHVLLGYDERGHCPMLREGACSIYAHRPRTCRTYDCRIFAAAGDDLQDSSLPLVSQRVRRWRFSYDEAGRNAQRAVEAAATFLRDRTDLFEPGVVPVTETQRAVVAVKVHDLFLPTDRGDEGALAAAIAERLATGAA
jgi:Fe-S-cluster containining protein